MVSFIGSQFIQATAPGAASEAVTVTAAGSAHTAGAWAELIASTNGPSSWLEVETARTSAVATFLVDLAIGAAGSEVPILQNVMIASNSLTALPSARISLPFSLPAGTRISARARCSVASSTVRMSATVYGAMAGGERGLTLTETFGAVTGTTRGVVLDPGASANTKGAWAQVAAVTSFSYRWMLLDITHPAVLGTSVQWFVDLGIGSGGSEIVAIPDRMMYGNANTDTFFNPIYSFPCNIPAGSRLAARAQSSYTTATQREVEIVIHGVG